MRLGTRAAQKTYCPSYCGSARNVVLNLSTETQRRRWERADVHNSQIPQLLTASSDRTFDKSCIWGKSVFIEIFMHDLKKGKLAQIVALTYESQSAQTPGPRKERLVFPLQLRSDVRIANGNLKTVRETLLLTQKHFTSKTLFWHPVKQHCLNRASSTNFVKPEAIFMSGTAVIRILPRLIKWTWTLNCECWKVHTAGEFRISNIPSRMKYAHRGLDSSASFVGAKHHLQTVFNKYLPASHLYVRCRIGTICNTSEGTRNILCEYQLWWWLSQTFLFADVRVGDVRMFHGSCEIKTKCRKTASCLWFLQRRSPHHKTGTGEMFALVPDFHWLLCVKKWVCVPV